MTQAGAAAALLWLSLTAYAVLGGADFGGGVWDIFAFGRRAHAQRRAVARAMGPVWEANHVWLIFMITGLFTTFPIAFSSLSVALYVPMTIALLGIVMRGAAFAFRAHGQEAVGPLSTWGIVFGGSSIIAPFFLGTAAAAVASGDIRIAGGQVVSGFGTGWSTPFAVRGQSPASIGFPHARPGRVSRFRCARAVRLVPGVRAGAAGLVRADWQRTAAAAPGFDQRADCAMGGLEDSPSHRAIRGCCPGGAGAVGLGRRSVALPGAAGPHDLNGGRARGHVAGVAGGDRCRDGVCDPLARGAVLGVQGAEPGRRLSG